MMKAIEINPASMSFGRYLKNARLDSGLKLKQVSADTRIAVDNLLAIEREDHERLPAEVFVKGFIRAYAGAVGADRDEAVKLYLASCRSYRESASVEADLIKSGLNFWPRLLLALAILVCLMILSVFVASLPHQADAPPKEALKPESIAEEGPGVSAPLSEPAAPAAPSQPASAAQKQVLRIITVEKTWIKVIIDDQKSKEYSLNPGDRLELEALSGFNLLIGNAAGVKLNLNQKDLAVPGKKGQVVTLKIP